MLKAPTIKTFDNFHPSSEKLLQHYHAIRKKLVKIKNKAKKMNDIITFVNAHETFRCLAEGKRNEYIVNQKRLEKSLAKLEELQEPYLIEEYMGKKYHFTIVDEPIFEEPNAIAYFMEDMTSGFCCLAWVVDGKLHDACLMEI